MCVFSLGVGRYQKCILQDGPIQMYQMLNKTVKHLVHSKPTWMFPLQLKSTNAQNMAQTCVISSNLWFVVNILSFPSIVCADKTDGG